MGSGSPGRTLPDFLEESDDDLDVVHMLCVHWEGCFNWLVQGRTTCSIHFVHPLSFFPMLWCLVDTQQCCLLALKLAVEFFSSFWTHPLASLCLSTFTGKQGWVRRGLEVDLQCGVAKEMLPTITILRFLTLDMGKLISKMSFWDAWQSNASC